MNNAEQEHEVTLSAMQMTDHNLLIEVNTNVKNLTTTLNAYTQSSGTKLDDHETRMRALEADNQQLKGSQRNQRWMLTILGAFVGIVGIVLTVIQVLAATNK